MTHNVESLPTDPSFRLTADVARLQQLADSGPATESERTAASVDGEANSPPKLK